MGDAQPIHVPQSPKEALRLLLARALNEKQLLILSEVDGQAETISSILRRLSDTHEIPLSTLKLNAKTLRRLGLIALSKPDAGARSLVGLTEAGKLVLGALLGETDASDLYE